jgi:GT2 family glycosyltransferase
MKLSVIIVNYNVKYFLEQCLYSVTKAAMKVETEVFLVDNNSVDGSVEMVRQKFPKVHVIANAKNVGFSKANNQAISASQGEYVLLLNPDTVVEEDTFSKVVAFMDAHADAGGLGVKMIDGSGRFLPESKRGLPTPSVAFYKIFGLSALFPRSRTFGKYHLGYLDRDKVHEVEVLAGAFMLMRRSVLHKTGLLDEDFFMYGEDIDMSYRIVKAGFKNYYFPETSIIHYKGESTKKSSVNYVFVFYNAMVIFARKHFSKKNAALFAFIIRLAIYLRAGIAITIRFAKSIFLPVLDVALLLLGMYFLKDYWSENFNVHYPDDFMLFAVPSYIFIWTIAIYFSGGYDKPIRLEKIIRGLFTGTLLILVGYALLPETYRFSRALILLGAIWAAIEMVSTRVLLNLFGVKAFSLDRNVRKRLLIVGKEDEANRVLSLLKMSETTHNYIGFITAPLPPEGGFSKENSTANENQKASLRGVGGASSFHLGSIDKFKEIVEVYSIDEIIFCARDIPSNTIINNMSGISGKEVEYKIAPPESLYIIGSSSVNKPGELYVIDLNSISSRKNKRNKRLFDVLASIILFVLSPVIIWVQKKPLGLWENVFKVLSGKYSWVGYHNSDGSSSANLPRIKKGILSPADAVKNSALDESTISRLNSLYAKDYRVYTDINILRNSWRELGN